MTLVFGIQSIWQRPYSELVERAEETFSSKEEVRETLLAMLEVNKNRMARMTTPDDSPFAYQNLALALACHYLEEEIQQERYPMLAHTITYEEFEHISLSIRTARP